MSDITTRLRNFVNTYMALPHESGWKFVTSAGADLSISIPETKIGVVGGGGALYIRKDGQEEVKTLRYGGVGGSFGWQLVPLPFNFDFSLKEMPNSGIIYTGPLAGRQLNYGDFLGACVLAQAAGQAGPGYSTAIMFLGGNSIASNIGAAGVILTCRAIVAFHGLNANLLPVSVGVSVMQGWVF